MASLRSMYGWVAIYLALPVGSWQANLLLAVIAMLLTFQVAKRPNFRAAN